MGIMASLTKAATGAGVSLEIARQTAIATDPGQRALDDPALGQDDEFVQFVALDDLDHPMAGSGCGLRDAWSMIAGMSEGALDEGKEAASAPIENQPRPVAVLEGRRDGRRRSAEGRAHRKGCGACAR